MPKFRKRPIVVEAHQWFKNGDHPSDRSELVKDGTGSKFFTEGKVVRYCRRGDDWDYCKHCNNQMHFHGWIETLEGGHIVCPSDWIITGVSGERYPCKADIFTKTYEEVT